MKKVAIVGLGLMGGSLARDLAQRGVEVLGFDRDAGSCERARSEGVIQESSRFPEGVASADLFVLAVPVTAAPDLLAAALPHLSPDCILTDLGSTKRSLVRAAERLGAAGRFVGSHPMAGDHLDGWSASRTGLFDGSLVYLTPTDSCSAGAVEAVRDLWTGLGARVRLVAAEEHDRQLAWSSHLPQIVASTLAVALRRNGVAPGDLGPGGRDATRLAGSSPEVWSAITLDNADAIQVALASVQESLTELTRAVRAGDAATLERLFEEGRTWSVRGSCSPATKPPPASA